MKELWAGGEALAFTKGRFEPILQSQTKFGHLGDRVASISGSPDPRFALTCRFDWSAMMAPGRQEGVDAVSFILKPRKHLLNRELLQYVLGILCFQNIDHRSHVAETRDIFLKRPRLEPLVHFSKVMKKTKRRDPPDMDILKVVPAQERRQPSSQHCLFHDALKNGGDITAMCDQRMPNSTLFKVFILCPESGDRSLHEAPQLPT